MNNQKEKAWNIFENTGKVADYLHYCSVIGEETVELRNKRNCFEPEEISQRAKISNSAYT